MRVISKKLVNSDHFDFFIMFLIITNAILIGVELDFQHPLIITAQTAILTLFTLEIVVRWIGKNSIREYVTDGWNWFDVFLVAIAYVPESWISQPEILTAFRILRVFRILRLFKAFPELQVIAKVLLRSIKSLFYICMLVILAVYLYSVVGVILFRGKSEVITGVGAIKDPFHSVPEGMFSMFRVLTGEDWTDLRYDLLTHSSALNDGLVTFFFVSFFVLSAFLLINIVVGAVVNNYDQVMGENAITPEAEIDSPFIRLNEQLVELSEKVDKLAGKT